MKINKRIYSQIQSEPFDVQQLANGGKIELHSLNSNEELYNYYAPNAKFAVWSSEDGKNYRLLLEDGYYERMRELYTTRVNQTWTNFWDEVEKGRRKVMLSIFLPSVIIAFLAATLLMVFAKKLAELPNGNVWQYVIIGLILVGFIVTNVLTNKKIDKLIRIANDKALNDIKTVVGFKHFDELMEDQQAYYNEFFKIEEDEEEQAEEPVEGQVQEEASNQESEKEETTDGE